MEIRKCTLLITYACNLSCTYCYERHKTSDPAKTMSFATARTVIQKEIAKLGESGRSGMIEFNFFGGEPLLQFPLIKSIVEWAETEQLTTKCYFTATTNGTLIDNRIKNWCSQHASHFSLGLSLDGMNESQRRNRGCATDELPVEFVRDTWPGQHFKMTVSQQTLPAFAANVLALQADGYKLLSSLAVGTIWTKRDVDEYARQLQMLSDHYLTHRNEKPMHLFLRSLPNLVDNFGKPQHKICGIGDTSIAYDVNGDPYPCISLTPVVTSLSLSETARTDFSENSVDFQDSHCAHCILHNECPTCYGQNLLHRGTFGQRDHNCCKMYLAELRVVTHMQINYLKQMTTPLNSNQRQRLSAARFILNSL